MVPFDLKRSFLFWDSVSVECLSSVQCRGSERAVDAATHPAEGVKWTVGSDGGHAGQHHRSGGARPHQTPGAGAYPWGLLFIYILR